MYNNHSFMPQLYKKTIEDKTSCDGNSSNKIIKTRWCFWSYFQISCSSTYIIIKYVFSLVILDQTNFKMKHLLTKNRDDEFPFFMIKIMYHENKKFRFITGT